MRVQMAAKGVESDLKGRASLTIDAFITVGNVEEIVVVLVLVIQRSHRGAGWWDGVVHEEEECFFRFQRNSLADEEIELPNGKVGRNEVFIFVKVSDTGTWRLLNDNRNIGAVFLSNLFALFSTLLERPFFLVPELHCLGQQ